MTTKKPTIVNVLGMMLGVLLLFAAPPAASSQAGRPGDLPVLLEGPAAEAGEALNPQLDGALNQLARGTGSRERYGADPDWRRQAQRLGFYVQGEGVFVTLHLLDGRAAAAAVAPLEAMGAQVVTRFDKWIDALVPPGALDQAAKLPGVRIIQRPVLVETTHPARPGAGRPGQVGGWEGHLQAGGPAGLWGRRPAAGTYVSEGVAASNANAWHAAGLNGAGIKVGVVDYFSGFRQAQEAGELPAKISAYPPGATLDQSSHHGTMVAEVIYDMAPGVSFLFASMPNSPPPTCTSLAERITGLAQAGSQIISSSLNFGQCGAGDGDPQYDPVALAASQVVDTYGVFYANSAGNNALSHWDGSFTDADADGYLDFAPGNMVNRIVPQLPAGFRIIVYLRWNDWPGTDQDYDLYLYRNVGGNQWAKVAVSQTRQNGSQPPTEEIRIDAPFTGYYGVVVYRRSATGAQFLDLATQQLALQFSVPGRSLMGAASSADVYAVAAVDVRSRLLEAYSSQGPTLGPGGAPNGGLAQPQLTAYTNVTTYSNQLNPNHGAFTGTSAATPHVTGAAALVWSANPCLTARQVGNFLRQRALDVGAPGYDYQYGYGLLSLGGPNDSLCKPVVVGQAHFLPLVRR